MNLLSLLSLLVMFVVVSILIIAVEALYFTPFECFIPSESKGISVVVHIVSIVLMPIPAKLRAFCCWLFKFHNFILYNFMILSSIYLRIKIFLKVTL